MTADATILVVDDSATKRYLLVSWLTRAGFRVEEAETGGDALTKLLDSDVDLVVLDVKLPDMSGFEVCERIKTDPEYGVLPVIHVSAHAVDVVDRAQGLNRGADAYLVEPIEPDELIATAQAVLRYYRARRQAETLAARMVRLAETTLAINSASTLAGLLQAAAEGAHAIFGGQVVVLAEESDGESLAAVGAPPMVRPWSLAERNVAVGSLVRTDQPADWDVVEWPEGESVAVAAARLRIDRPPVYVAVPSSSQTPGFPVLRQLAQAVAADPSQGFAGGNVLSPGAGSVAMRSVRSSPAVTIPGGPLSSEAQTAPSLSDQPATAMATNAPMMSTATMVCE